MNFVVPAELQDLSRHLQQPIEKIDDAIAFYLADSYRYYVQAVGAVDTGELLFSIHIEQGASGGGINTKYVVASADHAKIVETGWLLRARGQTSYPGRYPAQKAKDATMSEIRSGKIVDALEWRMGR
jgi:hypothetical protein